MSGLYIHIPYCRKRCHYCDFYKTTILETKPELLKAIVWELKFQKNFLKDTVIETIYFGGGTPSVLTYNELMCIFDAINEHYEVVPGAEITFEANPDDLERKYLAQLAVSPVNRLSIGIQSFDNSILKFMNRRHTAQQAIACVQEAKELGFESLSLDLIYGIPNTTSKYLEKNIKQLVDLEPTHISAYHLSIEEGTAFDRMRNRGVLEEIEDGDSVAQYEILVSRLKEAGYEQYEISNFSFDGAISRHNTNYWMQKEYLGIGPSAHSYNSTTRQWNVTDIRTYLDCWKKRKLLVEKEVLSEKERFNDYVMVRLRTKWGVDLEYITVNFGEKFRNHFLSVVGKYRDDFHQKGSKVCIYPTSFLYADYLIRKIFVI